MRWLKQEALTPDPFLSLGKCQKCFLWIFLVFSHFVIFTEPQSEYVKSQGLLEMPLFAAKPIDFRVTHSWDIQNPCLKVRGTSASPWCIDWITAFQTVVYIYVYVNVCLSLGCQLTVVRNVCGLQILVWQDKQFPKYWQSSPICIQQTHANDDHLSGRFEHHILPNQQIST